MSQKTRNKQDTKTESTTKQTQAKDLKNEELDQSTEDVQDAIDKVIDEKTEEIDLMDEIDKVLEENAEEFVKNYVQRGGE